MIIVYYTVINNIIHIIHSTIINNIHSTIINNNYHTYHSNNIIHIIYYSTIINNIIQVYIYAKNEFRQLSSRVIWSMTRGVTCNVHLGRPCQPCILCKQGNLSKYFHPKTWKNRAFTDQFRELEPALDIQLDSCICRRCIGNEEMMSVSSQSGFIPRWRQKSSPHKHCCVYT